MFIRRGDLQSTFVHLPATLMEPVDLRSDVLSRPTGAMIDAMTAAARERTYFGLREDPHQQLLEHKVAKLLGHEDALLFPTCTMANEVALQLLTRPGDLVAAPSDAHMVTSEANAPAVLSGVRIESVAGTAPMPPLAAWERMAGRRGDTQNPRVSTFAIENSHNRAGGAVVDAAYTCELGQLAKRYGLHLMVDGARLFNAAVALGCEPRELARHADTVSISLNKSLGAPNGAMLAGSRELIDRALVLRHRLGGGFRPTGILAAAAMVALESWPRLVDDHQRARRLYTGLSAMAGLTLQEPATNILIVVIEVPGLTPHLLCQRMAERGVLTMPFGEDRIRMVTYRDIDDAAIDLAIAAMAQCL